MADTMDTSPTFDQIGIMAATFSGGSSPRMTLLPRGELGSEKIAIYIHPTLSLSSAAIRAAVSLPTRWLRGLKAPNGVLSRSPHCG